VQSALGWTFLSHNALARAEAQLNPDTQGVRDELGFMSLHRAYADRFFPGTSTQQTRLRYVLFIPWIFRKVAEQRAAAQIRGLIEQEEVILSGRLKKGGQEGIIGGRTYPRPPSQPASSVYWNALGQWGILLGHANGDLPNRFQVYRAIRHYARYKNDSRDDDRQLLEEPPRIFAKLPKPPPEWLQSNAPLTFALTATEAQFVRDKFIGITMPFTNKPALLARLVQEGVAVSAIAAPWAPEIMALVDNEEQQVLQRARQAAAATAVGRAVYAALVEEIRAREDEMETAQNHREHLFHVIENYQGLALSLSVPELLRDQASLPRDLTHLIAETQSWLASKQVGDVTQLRATYAAVEYRRKGRRARLPATVAARERRAEWSPEEHPLASPLDYRWWVVQRLLDDLQVNSDE